MWLQIYLNKRLRFVHMKRNLRSITWWWAFSLRKIALIVTVHLLFVGDDQFATKVSRMSRLLSTQQQVWPPVVNARHHRLIYFVSLQIFSWHPSACPYKEVTTEGVCLLCSPFDVIEWCASFKTFLWDIPLRHTTFCNFCFLFKEVEMLDFLSIDSPLREIIITKRRRTSRRFLTNPTG